MCHALCSNCHLYNEIYFLILNTFRQDINNNFHLSLEIYGNSAQLRCMIYLTLIKQIDLNLERF